LKNSWKFWVRSYPKLITICWKFFGLLQSLHYCILA